MFQATFSPSIGCCGITLNVDVVNCLTALWQMLQLIRPKSGIKQLEKKMATLTNERDAIKNKMDQAEREGRVRTDKVRKWLEDVEKLEGQVADIDFQSVSCFNCYYCCSIIQRVATKLGEANELMSRASALDPIAIDQPSEPIISHGPLVGIESYVVDIVSYIDGGEGKIIGIYGMGGVGKTTILNSIRQHYLKHSKFDCVSWVVASKDCQLKRLCMDIAKSLKLETVKETDDQKTCDDKLFIYLKDRKYLLLLDDIWECLDLQLLDLAHLATEQGQQQQPRLVVVFTTRSETVCAQMKAKRKTKVKCLDSNQAWKLFKENSDGDVLSSDAKISSCAQALVEECASLPLALITVARAMLGKNSPRQWDRALCQIRDEHLWTKGYFSEEDSAVMYKAFQLSYDSLENDSVRECLLCCALWPEDYEIHKFEELIPCWIGCGIIREFNVINEAFAEGCDHLDALIAASLLEDYRRRGYCEAKHVKMHDVIREMALLMVSGLKGNGRKWIVKAIIGLSRLPSQEEWQEAERASFMSNEITSLQDYGATTFPKLSMLILQDNDLSGSPLTLFINMPLLTYLDIATCDITELPMEICSLTELQYLDSSYNPITTLPADFGRLCKLEYLLLRGTNLETIPNGTISNLSMLKWLDITDVDPICEQWWDELERFRGRHQISLGIAIISVNIERLNKLPYVSVWNLTLNGSLSSEFEESEFEEYDLDTLRWNHRVTANLEYLTISEFRGDELTMTGVNCKSNFGCLQTLKLDTLHEFEKIWLNGVGFEKLRELHIMFCYSLKDVSWVLQLPFLNLLKLHQCYAMKELISKVSNSNSKSSIRMLSLMCMDNLHRIANQPLQFPFLEYLHVVGCTMFKKLPAEILNHRLKEIRGDEDWWNNMDWDDESQKNSFAPFYIKV